MSETFEYTSNVTVEHLAARLRGATRVLATTHAKPDGDALGSVVAVVRLCQAIGVAAEGWLVGPFERNLLTFAGPTPLVLVDPGKPTLPGEGYDLVSISDTGAWTQLETLSPWLKPRVEQAIGFDHHARGDRVAGERLVDVRCGSTTALLIRLVDALGVDLRFGADAAGHGSIAEALYLGLATDTGWFRFQNARAPEFSLASRLLAAGVDKDRVYELIEQSHRAERLGIESRALASLKLVGAGDVALMRLRIADFAETGAQLEETSGVVNLPMVVGKVRAAVLLIETEPKGRDGKPGLVKISFRSKPTIEGKRMYDVNVLAATFGGGGHVHAAGARIKGSLDEAERAIVAELPTA